MKNTWIVGVSGGPDSMALLHYMKSCNFHVVAAHVNYNKRVSSKRDAQLVKSYCKANDIHFEYRDFEEGKGNFQKQARDFRYDFYSDLVKKYEAKGVALGHHRDDDLETYVMQKESGRMVYPGMQNKIIINEMEVWRPLLDKTKDELVAYCHEYDIPYGVDESNFELDYTRNVVRDRLKDLDTTALYAELENEKEVYDRFLSNIVLLSNPFSIEDYEAIETDKRLAMLRKWLNDKGVGFHYSKEYLETLDVLILRGKSQVALEDYNLSISYGEVMLHQDLSFSYTFNKLEYVENEHFSIKKEGKIIESVWLAETDFPITIRSYEPGDAIKLRYGTKRLNRFFVDRKIPIHERKAWLVVENCVKEVVFVHDLGCDIYHYSNNSDVYVVK